MPQKLVLVAAVVVAVLVVSVAGFVLLSNPTPNSGGDQNTVDTTPTSNPTVTASPASSSSASNPTSNPTSSGGGSSGGGGGGSGGSNTNPTAAPTVIVTPSPTLAPAGHESVHEDSADYVWSSSDVMNVQFSGTSISTSSPNASVAGSKITITGSGTYRFTGTLSDGQIYVNVNASDKGTVRLILSNVDIGCSSSSAIYVENAKKTVIVLEEGTSNTVRDLRALTSVSPNAAIFSSNDLTFYGSGSLAALGNSNDAITSRDGLIIKSGTITASSQDDGVRGKDYVVVKGGSLTVTSGSDGLISDNTDSDKGFITVENGNIQVTSGGDSFDAASDVTVTAGTISVTAGGGSTNTKSSTISMKGIKGYTGVTVSGGSITVSSADDALHSNGTITLTGGTYSLQSADDGIHADAAIVIDSPTASYPVIDIPKCYEGIESGVITINSGTIHVTASDDGVNGAGGNDGSGLPGPWGSTANSNYFLYINGGYLIVDSTGDGIDINGAIVMTGGYVIVYGPTSTMNGAIDYDTQFSMSGGFILSAGAIFMGGSQGPDSSSTQNSVIFDFAANKQANSLIHLRYNNGAQIFTLKLSKITRSVTFCSPDLKQGSSYALYTGGSSTGTLKDGIYQNGVYTPGNIAKTFTISSITTKFVGV